MNKLCKLGINKLCYKVTIYIIFRIFTATVNFNDYTKENYKKKCYTVLWKLCMADLNNVQN